VLRLQLSDLRARPDRRRRELVADGGTSVIGGLTAAFGREIVAAPIEGTPAVRVFSSTGALLDEWLATTT
jgi:hypothetical protein